MQIANALTRSFPLTSFFMFSDEAVTGAAVTRAIEEHLELDAEAQLLQGSSRSLRLSFRAAGGNLDQVEILLFILSSCKLCPSKNCSLPIPLFALSIGNVFKTVCMQGLKSSPDRIQFCIKTLVQCKSASKESKIRLMISESLKTAQLTSNGS